jgi:hypothetical protein
MLMNSDDWDEIVEALDYCRARSHQRSRDSGLMGYGYLAYVKDGVKRPLEVLEFPSQALRFVLGTRKDGEVFTRESVETFPLRRDAEEALNNDTMWTQKSPFIAQLEQLSK